MKTKITTKIVSNTEISKGIYRLALADAPGSRGLSDVADTAAPGQFVNVYLNSKTMLLPRPFGISDIETGTDGGKSTDIETGTDGGKSTGIETGADGGKSTGIETGTDGGKSTGIETVANNRTNVDIDAGAVGETRAAGDSTRIVLVYAVVGAGTAELASYAPGAEIQMLGPQGNGYDFGGLGRHVLLIGGGLGIPPLLFAARRIRGSALPGDSMKVTALLGYRDVPYYADGIGRYCDDVFCISEKAPHRGACSDMSSFNGAAGTDVGFASQLHIEAMHEVTPGFISVFPEINGTVMDLIASLVAGGRLDLSNTSILSCGPMPMLKAVAAWAAARGIPAQVSLEERMGCGYGACVGCTVEIKNEDAAFLRSLPPGAVPRHADSEQADASSAQVDASPVQADADPAQFGASTAQTEVYSTPVTVRKKVCKDGPVFRAESVIWR